MEELEMSNESNGNNFVFLLAGFGLGAIIGAAAGMILAPKAGDELRGDLGAKASELKGKAQSWIAEQRAKSANAAAAPEELGA